MDMGAKIKFHREQLGMTLEELGNRVGVGKSTVRKWEVGMIANMRRDKIAKVADALGISPDYLMGWDEEPQKTEEPSEIMQKISQLTPENLENVEKYIDFLLNTQ